MNRTYEKQSHHYIDAFVKTWGSYVMDANATWCEQMLWYCFSKPSSARIPNHKGQALEFWAHAYKFTLCQWPFGICSNNTNGMESMRMRCGHKILFHWSDCWKKRGRKLLLILTSIVIHSHGYSWLLYFSSFSAFQKAYANEKMQIWKNEK